MKKYSFAIEFTLEAEDDLLRLFEYKASNSSIEAAIEARDAILASIEHIKINPYMCPMADNDPAERKLVIPIGRKIGYVALFSIESETLIYVTAIRHQLEADFRR